MYLRRHSYDKFWRCPGWAGGGMRYPRRQRCDGGTLLVHGMVGQPLNDRWWRWRWHRCNKCDVVAIPVAVHWIDPAWWWHIGFYHLRSNIRDRHDLHKASRQKESQDA